MKIYILLFWHKGKCVLNINSVDVVLKVILFCWKQYIIIVQNVYTLLYKNEPVKNKCLTILKVILKDHIWCWLLTVNKSLSKLDYIFEKSAFFTSSLCIIFSNAWNKWCLIKSFCTYVVKGLCLLHVHVYNIAQYRSPTYKFNRIQKRYKSLW